MKATVSALCFKSKQLKDGTYPLMLRIAKSSKRRYVSLGLSVDEKHWDFEKNRPKRNCPNKEMTERLISDKINEYNSLILEFTAQQKEYTAESLVNALNKKSCSKTVSDLFEQIIAGLIRAIEKTLTGMTDNDIWKSLAYYNLIQRLLKNREERPTYDDIVNGLKHFEKVLSYLRPHKVIFCGVKAGKYFASEMSKMGIEVNQVSLSGEKINGAYPRIFDIIFSEQTIRCHFIKHPSMRYTAEKWQKVINLDI